MGLGYGKVGFEMNATSNLGHQNRWFSRVAVHDLHVSLSH